MPQLATICYIDNGKALLRALHRNKKPNDVHEGKWIGVMEIRTWETPTGVQREILRGRALEPSQS